MNIRSGSTVFHFCENGRFKASTGVELIFCLAWYLCTEMLEDTMQVGILSKDHTVNTMCNLTGKLKPYLQD